MIKNYLKTAWRNLVKNKFYSLLNIGGLTVGLSIGILILLWVQDELSYDGFHKQTADIYRLELFGGTGTSRQIWEETVAPIGPLAKQQLPEVREFVRITPNWFFSLFTYQDKVFGNESVAFADPSFFSVFDFPLIKGNQSKPFAGNNSVIITQKTATKYFGAEDPVGKVIVADHMENFTVAGVIKDFPNNSSMHYDMLMPMTFVDKQLLKNNVDVNNDFSNFNYTTFLLLKPGTSLKNLAAKLFQIHIKHKSDDTDAEYLLLPLSKMHLYNADGTNAGIDNVRIFFIIAVLILGIASINYINLSTARSMLRIREISMRKIIGAGKWQLFMQFIMETSLLFLLVTLLALSLFYFLIPVFNQVSGKQLALNVSGYHAWLLTIVTIAATLAASCIYPALLLSSFEPLKALKGKISPAPGNALSRKILVIVQFTISVVLIAGTLVISRQLNYIRNKELGYDKTNIFSFWMRYMDKHFDAAKSELVKNPGVVDITRASTNIIDIGGITGSTDWDGKGANQTFIVHPLAVDSNFISFFKMKLVAGSGFKGGMADSTHFILNETAAGEIGMKDPIGKRFKLWNTNGTIIGIVKDFHFKSMKQKIGPSVFLYDPSHCNHIFIKITGRDIPEVVDAAKTQFGRYNGDYPFGYAFMDETFNNLYRSEQREGTLFNYFAGIAILISCLGLLGLASYTAQIRTREIGVRKVLGASVSGIIRLLATDFIRLVFIAILIAIPVAWYVMAKWLEGFAYRISMGWTIFLYSGTFAILIAFITISFQSLRAAVTNPVKSLRND